MTAVEQTQAKTVYLPYMCDHVHMLSAALRAQGVAAEVLPPPDDESLAIGLDLCRGRECLPCFTSTGDIIRRARRPDFDPQHAAVVMPTTAGPCRFGQYSALQRDILERQGLGAVEILSPSASNSYQGFGPNPTRFRKLAWQGIVAVDLLQKLLHEYRPYEREAGATDAIYQASLEQVIEAAEAGGGKALIAAMRAAARRFEGLAIDRQVRRPVIGVLGEIYLRANTYSNQNLIRRVEAAGGEVLVASMMEWLYFTNWDYLRLSRITGNYLDYLTTFVTDQYQQHQERRLLKEVEHLLARPHDTPVGQLIAHVQPYYPSAPGSDTEAVLSMGKAIDFAHQGIAGILNVMPFSCMPGIITAGMAPRLRADLGNIPWLDVIYDAQGGTNLNTRLEAFMYQAAQFCQRIVGAD